MKLEEIVKKIDDTFPIAQASEHDNVGLMVGNYDDDCEKMTLAYELNDDVVNEVLENRSNLVVTYHTPLFRPVNSLTSSTSKRDPLFEAIRSRVNVFALHTALDLTKTGLNHDLAMRIGLRNIRFLSPIKNNLCKIVVFVPPSHSAKVREALSTSGAGQIGNYSGCSFASNGTGSFIPNHDASPYIGHPGQPESVGEVRLEMIIDKSLAGRAISEMLKAHPYEEPAYDIYPLMNDSPDLGFGAIGEFDEPISFKRFILDLKNILELESIKISHSPHVEVRKVALCAGSGVPFYDDAMRDGADIFITGDVKHHDFRRASTCRTILADVTHIGSEKFATEVMFNDFKKVFLNEIEIQTSKTKPVNAITI